MNNLQTIQFQAEQINILISTKSASIDFIETMIDKLESFINEIFKKCQSNEKKEIQLILLKLEQTIDSI